MIINDALPFPVYGDMKFRGDCPIEDQEQISFLNKMRKEYPETWGKLVVHIKNEGLVKNGQFRAISKHKAMGLVAGAPDIVIPGAISFLCEMKRANRTKSSISKEQVEYLVTAQSLGAFVCVALGAQAAWDAFQDYLVRICNSQRPQ